MIRDESPGSKPSPPSGEDDACCPDLIAFGPSAALRAESDDSPARLLSERLTPQDWLDYEDFGNLSGHEGAAPGDRYRFEGRERDADLAMQYNRCRHYDPAPGRWLADGAPSGEPGRSGGAAEDVS